MLKAERLECEMEPILITTTVKTTLHKFIKEQELDQTWSLVHNSINYKTTGTP